jgi:hypothetical protein
MIKSHSYIYKKSKIRNAKPDWKVPEGRYIYRKSKIRNAKPDWIVPEGRYIYRKSKIREVKPHRGDIYIYTINLIFFSQILQIQQIFKKNPFNILSQ